MANIVVYGAGGMGKEVAEVVLTVARIEGIHRFLGFLEDRPTMWETDVLGYPVLGDMEWVRTHPDTAVVLGFGHPWSRYQAVLRLREINAQFATIIHPSAEISPSATLGEGTVIFPGCMISTEARLGDFCYLNYRVVISHDAWMDAHVCVMSQVAISGNVRVGEGAFIGVGATTKQGVSIGEWSLIGAGAVVVHDIPPLCVAVGVPAKPTRSYVSRTTMPTF